MESSVESCSQKNLPWKVSKNSHEKNNLRWAASGSIKVVGRKNPMSISLDIEETFHPSPFISTEYGDGSITPIAELSLH